MRKIICFILIIITFGALGVNAADKFVLVIDAGHGGHDPGARGKVSLEKNINLSVALAFGKYVERNCPDVKVIYTRKTDVFIELSERANIANKNKADLFISIHTNALDGGKISRGVETYTLGIYKAAENLNVAKRENSVILIEKNYKQRYAGFDPNSSESYIMFELMQDKNMANSVELAKTIQSEVCASSGRVNKGVHQAGFLVLRETSMPSCLLELGFITTTDEETYLNTTEGQDKMARGIYNAFVKYKRKHGMKLAQNDDNESQDYENPEYDMVSNGMRSSVEELAEGETPESRQYDNDRELS
ncbi:MAG: N-acetylmuramoyl-L-alanine amidase, partial [Prevotella sp.]|nr:N-acetylmuramoyl-L-alanine amidase [Prevotella sp.]